MFSGLEEAVHRNINACKQFAQSVRSAYGPNGMNKMIINHIDKQFITSDAGTIIRELDVEHPAAKLMVLASQMQDAEVGDGTNFVIVISGGLLEAAEELLRLGVTTSEIAEGYEMALDKCLEILPELVCHEVKDFRNYEEVTRGIRSSIMSKQYGHEDFIAGLVAKACISILPENTTFNVDNVRICKVSVLVCFLLYCTFTMSSCVEKLWIILVCKKQEVCLQYLLIYYVFISGPWIRSSTVRSSTRNGVQAGSGR